MPSIERNGLRIAYDAAGSGPCVVMTHSFLCDRSLFRRQVQAMQPRFRVINIDLRGHGESGDSEQPFSVYDLVDDVLAVLDHERVDRAVWAGLSIGGFLSMRAALRHPQRVQALVLMNTDAGPESAFKAFKYGVLRLGLKTLGPGPIVPSLLPIFLGGTTLREQADLSEAVKRQFLAMRVPSIAEGVRTIVTRDDIRGELGRIRCPTLVIAGAEDQPLPPPKSEDIARRIPGAELVVVPRCGHLSAIEAPEAVNRHLLAFLDGPALRPAAAGWAGCAGLATRRRPQRAGRPSRSARSARALRRRKTMPQRSGARGVDGLADRGPDLAAFGTGRGDRRAVDGEREFERAQQARPLRVVATLEAEAAAEVALAGQQQLGEPRRAAQRVAALEQPQQRRRRQLQAAVHMAVLGCGDDGQLAAVVGRLQARGHVLRQGHAARLVADVPGPFGARRGALAEVVAQAGEAHRQRCAGRRCRVEHLHDVHAGVDLGVVLGRLRHAPQAVDLGQQPRQRAATAQHREQARRRRLQQPAGEFLPDAFGDQRVGLAGSDHRAHQRGRLGRHGKVRPACGEARHAQDAHRVLGEGRRNMPQHARTQVLLPAVRVDERAVGAHRHGVDRQVAPRQVLRERHRRLGVHDEAAVAGSGLALGARQRVFLAAVGVQEDGEVGADLAEARREHLCRRRADDHPVAVAGSLAEQRVAHRAADDEALEGGCGVAGWRSMGRGTHRADNPSNRVAGAHQS
jgi:pimeloyl-ACP methyl ester carboxylesterase